MTIQNVENLCVRCEMRFRKWTDYHAHVIVNTCAKLFRPVNTSGRSKAQIVADWESNNGGVFIQ